MPHLVHKFIQQALYAVLNEDSALSGMVMGGVTHRGEIRFRAYSEFVPV